MHGLNGPLLNGLKTLLFITWEESLLTLYIEERRATKEIQHVINKNALFVIFDNNNRL